MKKSMSIVFAFLMLAGVAVAQVTTEAAGQKATLKAGSVVTTDGSKATTVNYEGVTIVVPQGVKAKISKTKDGKILVQGENLNGVKIGDNTISSTGKAALTVTPGTLTIAAQSGTVTVTNAQGQTATVAPAPAPAKTTTTTVEAPAFVDAGTTNSAANQQASQNVEEDKQLSPSTPN